MRYEDFRATWERTIGASKLGRHGFTEETLDSQSLDRTYLVRVEPPQGQDSRPFHVVAELSWRWSALQTARSRYGDDELVTELLASGTTRKTAKPWLRVDIKLSATLMLGHPIEMPTPRVWSAWAREVLGRLERIEPVLPKRRVRERKGGALEVLAWSDEAPTLEVKCSPMGELRLAGVSLDSWVAVELPRARSSDEGQEKAPDDALVALFGRLERALSAWSESVDHLRPTPTPGGRGPARRA